MKPCRYCAEEIQAAAIVCRFCNRHQSPPTEPADNTTLNAVLALIVVLVIGAGGFMLGQRGLDAGTASAATAGFTAGGPAAGKEAEPEARPAPRPPPPPPPSRFTLMDARSADLDSGQYMVHAFDLRDWNCSVRGDVAVMQGGSRDVDVFFVDENGLASFKAGTEFETYFSRRRTTEATLDLGTLSPGRYYLIVSNRFSWFTGKTVSFGSMAAECTPGTEDGSADSEHSGTSASPDAFDGYTVTDSVAG